MNKRKLKNEAKEFAEYLLESEIFQNFLKAHENLKSNKKIVKLMADYEEKQTELQNTGFNSELLNEVKQIERKINQNKLVNEFNESRAKLLAFLKDTNRAISEEIGQEFAYIKPSCGCGC
ncbi:MAG: YlbF family regulator [Candidatus Woesearchaeota archaeon]